MRQTGPLVFLRGYKFPSPVSGMEKYILTILTSFLYTLPFIKTSEEIFYIRRYGESFQKDLRSGSGQCTGGNHRLKENGECNGTLQVVTERQKGYRFYLPYLYHRLFPLSLRNVKLER